ncbi:MAG: ribosome small subunit-dependent GTPase A [Phycisphaerae bacterium]|nr:ribosome small subunit-dependent GTPase A [Phycisphaerae bacterium]
MAKHKGKSKRRVKDWQVRYESGEDVEDVAANKQKFSPREIKLGDGSFAAGGADELVGMDQREGVVAGVFRRGVYVRVGTEQLFCGIAKTFRAPDGAENTTPLAVGDDVTIALTRKEHMQGQTHLDRNRMDGMILSRSPRRTLLVRPEPRSGKRRESYDTEIFHKVIAANVDVLLIVSATVKPPMRRGLIDRFLIIAERGELIPLLVVNKIDLDSGDEEIIEDVAAQGVKVLKCSAETGEGLDALAAELTGKRSVFTGASGVGKTSLVNAMLPDVEAATREVREKDQRGRHTTSQSVIYDLPGGGLLIDTPGIRELGVGLKPEELSWYFPEIEQFSAGCKFRNCSHTHEPQCAVIAAAESGEILPRRFESYLRILASIEDE